MTQEASERKENCKGKYLGIKKNIERNFGFQTL